MKGFVRGWVAAVVYVGILGPGHAGVLPLPALVVLQLIAVVVEPAVVVPGAVGEVLALGVVLADCLAVRGGVHVLDVNDLVLWTLLAGEPVEEVVLAGEVLLTIVAGVQVWEGSPVDTVLLPVATVMVCCPATGPVEPAGSPVLWTLLSPVAPELTLGVVLTHGLAVTGGVDVSDLSYHVIVTQGPLSHIARGQGRLHGGRGLHSGGSRGLTVGDGRRRWTTHTARARLCGVAGGEEEALGPDVGEEVTLRVVPAGVLTLLHVLR